MLMATIPMYRMVQDKKAGENMATKRKTRKKKSVVKKSFSQVYD